MKIAFYYHIPISLINKNYYLPGFLGTFIDALASKVELLYLIMHEGDFKDELIADYRLKSKNLIWLRIGKKSSALKRTINSKEIISSVFKKIKIIDMLIVRAPTPLGIFFYHFKPKNIKIVYLIVGDYHSAAQNVQIKNLKSLLVKIYSYITSYHFLFLSKNFDVLVNSPTLYDKYKLKAKSTKMISTTTLSSKEFFARKDTCKGDTIKLLYVGRIDQYKGLFELLLSFKKVTLKTKKRIELHIVGWEDNIENKISKSLKRKAKELSADDKVFFHGYVNYGKDLNQIYIDSDIFILPTYFDSFPRTIFEAMSKSLPVISTNVGSIPNYLKNGKNSLLVQPKDYKSIKTCVLEIISNEELRRNLIKEGFKLASSFTIEKQINVFVKNLKEYK